MGWFEEGEGASDVVKKVLLLTSMPHGRDCTRVLPDCEILKCLVDEKGLKYCHECEEFVCSRGVEWSEKSSQYKETLRDLERLKVHVD